MFATVITVKVCKIKRVVTKNLEFFSERGADLSERRSNAASFGRLRRGGGDNFFAPSLVKYSSVG